MPRPKKQKKTEAPKPTATFYTLNEVELEKFEEEMKKYLRTYENNGKKLQYYDQMQYLKDMKALTETGAVVLYGVVEDGYGHITGYDKPLLMDVLIDKLDQLRRWRQKRKYTLKMEIEQSEKIAERMKIDSSDEITKPQAEERSKPEEITEDVIW